VPGLARGGDSLFSTHPDTGNRIAALEELAVTMGQSAPRDVFAAPAPAERPSALGVRAAPRRGSALDPNRRG
jgi:heat shock protein HtpX